ncbi:MAG: GspH/FimT family pseudopilin [Pseudomonadota bacterium]|nr:GspH/FimT family pseudopilin [Pseudomonadota bacterium]
MKTRTHPIRRHRGFSLIESMTVLAVMAVTVGTVAPSFTALRDVKRLEGAAAQIETELQFARSLAVARNETVRFTFRNGSGAGCYVIHTGAPNACVCGAPGVPAQCSGSAEALREVSFAAEDRLSIRTASGTFGFDPTRGTVTPTATLRLSAPAGQTLHLVVNILGRVRSCTPNGVPGYKAC